MMGPALRHHHFGNVLVDVYGQLSDLYATQKDGQMAPIGGMLSRLMECCNAALC